MEVRFSGGTWKARPRVGPRGIRCHHPSIDRDGFSVLTTHEILAARMVRHLA
jgi:hypothetical protein